MYSRNFSLKIVNYCLNTIKCTYDENSLKELKNILSFFLNLTKAEFRFIKDGFVLTNQSQSGIVIDKLLNFPSEGFSIVFSFLLNYQEDNINQKESTLISFVNLEENNKDLLKIYIKDMELYIFIKEEWRTGFKVEPFKFYLVSINQEQPGFLKKNKSKVILI